MELVGVLAVLALTFVVPFLIVAAVVIVVLSVARQRSPLPRLTALAWTVAISVVMLGLGWTMSPLLGMLSGAVLTWAVARRGYELDATDYALIAAGCLASWF